MSVIRDVTTILLWLATIAFVAGLLLGLYLGYQVGSTVDPTAVTVQVFHV